MTIEAVNVTPELLRVADLVNRAFLVEANDEFLERVRAYTKAPVSSLVPAAQKYAERGAHQLDSALVAYDKADDKPLWRDYLDASYAELFLGVSPKGAEPVESCYLNDERVLYADQYFQVKEAMEQAGFEKPADFYEPEDHLSMEWAFLVKLLGEGELAQADAFKAGHIDAWFERAFADMVDRDDVGFYTGIVNLARAVLAQLG